MKFYTFSLSITTADVIRVLTEAIAFFGGYALELVMDNGKQRPHSTLGRPALEGI
jgi:transposase